MTLSLNLREKGGLDITAAAAARMIKKLLFPFVGALCARALPPSRRSRPVRSGLTPARQNHQLLLLLLYSLLLSKFHNFYFLFIKILKITTLATFEKNKLFVYSTIYINRDNAG